MLEAKRRGSVLGRWWPDRRPQVGSKSVKHMGFEAWLRGEDGGGEQAHVVISAIS